MDLRQVLCITYVIVVIRKLYTGAERMVPHVKGKLKIQNEKLSCLSYSFVISFALPSVKRHNVILRFHENQFSGDYFYEKLQHMF